MSNKVYSIQFTEAGLAYVRRALGLCPYDEAGPLIANMEVQRQEQDKPATPAEPAAPPVATAARPARARKPARKKPAALNGSGAAPADASAH